MMISNLRQAGPLHDAVARVPGSRRRRLGVAASVRRPGWPGLFGVRPTPLKDGPFETFRDPCYAAIALEF